MPRSRLQQAFEQPQPILNIYFTAGFPHINDTVRIAKALERAGADMIEIGIPFSDPVADGPTIQNSSQTALENGMSVKVLFEQLADIRKHVSIPILLMGYINPVIQYGVERFFEQCAATGIDGVIIPDLPLQEYLEHYQATAKAHAMSTVFLISPNTTEQRIRTIDQHTDSFIYMVSSASTTGAKQGISEEQIAYFERINKMALQHPRLIGFGISDRAGFERVCHYAQGGIVGSAFIKQLDNDASDNAITAFVRQFKQA